MLTCLDASGPETGWGTEVALFDCTIFESSALIFSSAGFSDFREPFRAGITSEHFLTTLIGKQNEILANQPTRAGDAANLAAFCSRFLHACARRLT